MEKEMETIRGLKELLLKDVNEVVNKGQITAADYQCLDKAVDIWKDLDTIKAMGEYQAEMGMVSGNMYPMHPMNSMNSYSLPNYGNGANSGYYPMDNSFARGRSPYTGQYVSRDEEVQAKLNSMMQGASTMQERQIIQRMMNEL